MRRDASLKESGVFSHRNSGCSPNFRISDRYLIDDDASGRRKKGETIEKRNNDEIEKRSGRLWRGLGDIPKSTASVVRGGKFLSGWLVH